MIIALGLLEKLENIKIYVLPSPLSAYISNDVAYVDSPEYTPTLHFVLSMTVYPAVQAEDFE